MANVATEIPTQIRKLKTRGLIIADEVSARETLLDIGYYRLGFYWHYFETDNVTHNFEPGLNIEDVVKLYYFDFDLKYLLSKYLYRIEVHFRTQVVYWGSNRYRHDNAWYCNSRYVDSSILGNFSRMYNKLKRDVPTLMRHHAATSCTFAPAWKTFEFLTFGQVFTFYVNIRDVRLKNQIAAIYGLTDYTFLENYMKAIINIRNICSHNGTLYDFSQPTGIFRINDSNYTFQNRDGSSLNSSLILIGYILSKISVNRENEMKENIKKLMERSAETPRIRHIILNKIKFAL